MSLIAKANENPVVIRFPRSVLDAVTESARRNGRSRNSEVVMRIAQSLGVEPSSSSADVGNPVTVSKV